MLGDHNLLQDLGKDRSIRPALITMVREAKITKEENGEEIMEGKIKPDTNKGPLLGREPAKDHMDPHLAKAKVGNMEGVEEKDREANQ